MGIDRSRIAVGGDSAGGALAAACALRARDEGKLRICFQLLVYPVTDSRMETDSMEEFDCLYDEGMIYARELEEAGVGVQLEDVKGAFHGFDFFTKTEISY